jgi:hypothetical protein
MSSAIVLTGESAQDIRTIARFIEEQIAENWSVVLETKQAKLIDAYNRGGDLAYGTYCELLFRPIQRQLKQAGVRFTPDLPGDFEISREWGNPHETDQQRWMWSTLSKDDSTLLGTIVIKFYHDHTQFRVPRPPKVLALTETGKEPVVAALVRRSADFRRAREASIEIAEYLESLKAKA